MSSNRVNPLPIKVSVGIGRALKLIKDKRRWCQGSEHEGRGASSQYCALGAIRKAFGLNPNLDNDGAPKLNTAIGILNEVARKKTFSGIVGLNDAQRDYGSREKKSDLDHKRVIDAFKEAHKIAIGREKVKA
jgi:hypothetical protein